MKLAFSLLLSISCLAPLNLYAVAQEALSLEQALAIATENNPQFKAARAQLGINDAEILTAQARLNPSIVSDNGVAEKTYRLGIEQTVELGAKRQKRIALAQAQRNMALAEINTQLLELRSDVRRTYTQAYNAQERQQNHTNILQVTQELVTIARKREKAGDISQLDVLQTEIVSLNAQNDLQTLTQEVINSRSRLNSLLNQPLKTDFHLVVPSQIPRITAQTKVLPPNPNGPVLQGSVSQVAMDLDSLIEEAYQHRPELHQLSQHLEVTRRQMTLAQANRIPNFTLALGPDLVIEPGQRRLNVFMVGSMEVPVFNRQQGPIQEVLARRAKLEQEKLALRNRIVLDVTNAHTAFQMNQERVKRYKSQLLPYSVAIVDKSRRAFEEGKAPILIPLNAQQAYINTRLGYLQALMDLQNAISDLERAVGAGL